MNEQKLSEMEILPWLIPAGDDGLNKDAILVAVMKGCEMVSVSLHMAFSAPQES